MRGSRTRRATGGFTLIEVLVALVVLMIGLLGLIALVRTAFTGAGMSRRANEAAVLAEQQLEVLRTVPITAGTTTEVIDGRGVASAEGPFTRTVTITSTTSGTLGTMLVVAVDVAYDLDGDVKHTTLYTERLP